ncbi:hypothetical protein [Streptomyces sp. NPDC001381]|uniref:hypothetical protein n=1 Tax=Streptomyces sp. NPDC001381 TaxID=3364567 RepID=UPI0036CC4287
MYRYFLRQVLVGDGRRPGARRWRRRSRTPGLPALGLALGQEVAEAQLRSLYGEGRHPDADRLGADPATAVGAGG